MYRDGPSSLKTGPGLPTMLNASYQMKYSRNIKGNFMKLYGSLDVGPPKAKLRLIVRHEPEIHVNITLAND